MSKPGFLGYPQPPIAYVPGHRPECFAGAYRSCVGGCPARAAWDDATVRGRAYEEYDRDMKAHRAKLDAEECVSAAHALTVATEVRRIIAERLDCDREEVLPTSTLEEIGGDSLAGIETLLHLEEAFVLDVPDDDAMAWRNVQDVVDYIATKTASNAR